MYATYVNNYSDALATLADVKTKNKQFEQFLRSTQDNPASGRLPLTDQLYMPVTRLTGYGLLLQELLKITPTSHVDYRNVEEALKKVKQMADYVNEHGKMAANMATIVGDVTGLQQCHHS